MGDLLSAVAHIKAGFTPAPTSQDTIVGVCVVLGEVERMLTEKNRAYGDSALNPLRVFSRAEPIEQIKIRIDDKISRLARGNGDTEDTEMDLLGYLVLLRVARRKAAVAKP